MRAFLAMQHPYRCPLLTRNTDSRCGQAIRTTNLFEAGISRALRIASAFREMVTCQYSSSSKILSQLTRSSCDFVAAVPGLALRIGLRAASWLSRLPPAGSRARCVRCTAPGEGAGTTFRFRFIGEQLHRALDASYYAQRHSTPTEGPVRKKRFRINGRGDRI
jgi:hypothetical protein